MFMYFCKQIFHIYQMGLSQKLEGATENILEKKGWKEIGSSMKKEG